MISWGEPIEFFEEMRIKAIDLLKTGNYAYNGGWSQICSDIYDNPHACLDSGEQQFLLAFMRKKGDIEVHEGVVKLIEAIE